MTSLRAASFRTQAPIYFKEGNDCFRVCERDLSKKILGAILNTTKVPWARFRSRACIHFKYGNDSFRVCERDIAEKILGAMASGNPTGIVTVANEIKRSRNFRYDLERMKLINLATEETEDIMIVFPWDPKSLISIIGNGHKILKRQLLRMALDRIRKRSSLVKILTMKEVSTSEIRENPYLFASHPPYNNFIESLYNFLEEKTRSQGNNLQPTLFERFLDCASDDATPDAFATIDRGNIRMVFHGTTPEVMDGILYTGLQSKFRQSGNDRDFFGLKASESALHTRRRTCQVNGSIPPPKTKVKLLLFIVINSNEVLLPTITDFNNERSVSVHSNECELPLAEITIRCN